MTVPYLIATHKAHTCVCSQETGPNRPDKDHHNEQSQSRDDVERPEVSSNGALLCTLAYKQSFVSFCLNHCTIEFLICYLSLMN